MSRTRAERDRHREILANIRHENRDMHELIVTLLELCRTIDEAAERIANTTLSVQVLEP